MKTRILILLLALCGSIASAQKSSDKAEETYWGANDTYKNATDVPDKWKNESAVIIYKFENYSYYLGFNKL